MSEAMIIAENLHKPFSTSVTTGDAAIAEAKEALWSGTTSPSPQAIVKCRTASDVQASVKLAATKGLPLSVLAGGHDWAGRSVRESGLVLDVRPLCDVRVDPNAMTATVGGGALTRDVLRALPADLVTVTGTILTVGVAGLTLGGGYGRLNSRFGMAVDALQSAQVVLADGQLVTASEQENADLFWALRGGGGNFGVVTSLTMSLYRVPSVLDATLFVSLSSAKRALLAIQAMLDAAPDELSIFSGFMTFPSGDPGLFIAPLWSGNKQDGERWCKELSSLDGAQTIGQKWCSYQDTFDPEAEKAWPKGRSYWLDARNFPRLDEETADILLDGAQRFPSPACAIVIHDFHGAPSRIARDATAFSPRRDHFNCELIGAWDASPNETGAKQRAWVQDLAHRLSNQTTPGGYVNLLAPDDQDLVRQSFGDACHRLAAIKQKVDPHDLFSSAVGRW